MKRSSLKFMVNLTGDPIEIKIAKNNKIKL